MLHNLMIMSGKGGIVLYRKIFTKVVHQPRIIAALVGAMSEFAAKSDVGVPINTIELDAFTISVVEIPMNDTMEDNARNCLRAVLFYDTADGDFYGHVLGIQFLTTFRDLYGERLQSTKLANVQGVEETFKGFSTNIRPAVKKSINPLMQILESHVGVKDVFLLGHRRDGMFVKTVEDVLYSSSGSSCKSSLIADVQALLAVGDDLMSSKRDVTSVVNVGANIRIQRLDYATLVVVTQPPHTSTSCQHVISTCTNVLRHLFQLMHDLEGSTGVRS